MWQWRTNANGYIEVDQGDGNGYVAITLPGPDAQTVATSQWTDLANDYAALNGIPTAWILAVIYSESAGNPRATNFCCGGLMALSRAVYKTTTTTETDPDLNVKLGSATLAQFAKQGYDIPTVASMYNAGPSSSGGAKKDSTDPWGMVENRPAVPWTGYIEKIVRAYNWWLAQLSQGTVPDAVAPVASDTSSSSGLLAFFAGAVAGWFGFKFAKQKLLR